LIFQVFKVLWHNLWKILSSKVYQMLFTHNCACLCWLWLHFNSLTASSNILLKRTSTKILRNSRCVRVYCVSLFICQLFPPKIEVCFVRGSTKFSTFSVFKHTKDFCCNLRCNCSEGKTRCFALNWISLMNFWAWWTWRNCQLRCYKIAKQSISISDFVKFTEQQRHLTPENQWFIRRRWFFLFILSA
jgi:hypothetical protein